MKRQILRNLIFLDLNEEEDESNEMEFLDKADRTEEEPISPLSLQHSKETLQEFWQNEGLAHLPKRRITKVIEYSIVDGQPIAKVR
jgi:hypothetical protein